MKRKTKSGSNHSSPHPSPSDNILIVPLSLGIPPDHLHGTSFEIPNEQVSKTTLVNAKDASTKGQDKLNYFVSNQRRTICSTNTEELTGASMGTCQ